MKSVIRTDGCLDERNVQKRLCRCVKTICNLSVLTVKYWTLHMQEQTADPYHFLVCTHACDTA